MMPVVIILLGGVISGLLLVLFTVFLCKVCRCTCHQMSIDGSSVDSKYINCSREISSNNVDEMACSISGISHEVSSQNATVTNQSNSPNPISPDTPIPCKPRQFNTSFSVNKPSFADVVLAISKEKRQRNRPKRFRSSFNPHRSLNISKLRSSSYNAVCQPMIYPKTDSMESKASAKSFLFPPDLSIKPSLSNSFDLENYNEENRQLVNRELTSLDVDSPISSEYIELLMKADRKKVNKFRLNEHPKCQTECDVSNPAEFNRTRLRHVTKLNTWTLSQDTSFDSDDSIKKPNERSPQSSPYSIRINDSGYRSVNQSSSPTNGIFDFSLTIPDFGNSKLSNNMKTRTASYKRKSFSKQKIIIKDRAKDQTLIESVKIQNQWNPMNSFPTDIYD